MAREFTKIPENTFEALQVDAGVLMTQFDPTDPELDDQYLITATTGGIKVSCVPTYTDWGEDVDNCPNKMKELMHLDGWDCKISTTAIGTSPAIIQMALGAADVSGSKITPRASLEQTDFKDLWWVGDRADGGCVAVKLMNALSTGGFSLSTTKNGKGQFELEISCHVSLAAQDVVPMEFYSIDPPPYLHSITVTSSSGGATSAGDSLVSVSGYTLGSGESYVYKTAKDTAPVVAYGDDVSSGWTALTTASGTNITVTSTHNKITVVAKDSSNKAVAAGSATLNIK